MLERRVALVGQNVEHRYKPGAAMLPEPLPFSFLAAGDVQAFRDADLNPLIYGIEYEIAGDGAGGNATIRMRTVWAVDEVALVRRATSLVQDVQIEAHKPLPADDLSKQLDRNVMSLQEQRREISETSDRALMLPRGEKAADLPPVEVRGDTALTFDSAGVLIVRPLGSFPPGPMGGNVLSAGPVVDLDYAKPDAGVNQLLVDGYAASGDGGAGLWEVGGAPDPGFVPTRACRLTANNRVTRIPKGEPVSLSRFGIDQFAIRDQWPELNDTFDIASHEGYSLLGNPDARYRKDGRLLLQGASFDGQGCSFEPLSDAPQAIVVYPLTRAIDRPFRLANFTTLGAAIERSASNDHSGIQIGAIELDAISDIALSNIIIGSVDPTRGHASAGLYIANASRVRGDNITVKNTKADGFHVTHGAQDIWLYSPIADRVGDDSFAVVSYRSYGRLCNNVLFDRGLSVNGGSRGCATVGGRNVVYRQPTIRGSAAAAVYIASEASFDTFGCDKVEVVGLTAEGCVVGGGATPGGPDFRNAIVILAGREGSDVIDGQTFERSVRDCSVSGIIRGNGAFASQSAEYNNPRVVRPRIDLDIEDVLSNIPGVLHGGVDADLRLNGRGLGGNPIVIGANAVGRHYIHDCKIDRARQANPPADVNVLLMAAPAITELRIERAEFNETSANFYNDNAGFDTTRLRTRSIKIDGVEATGRDYMTAVPTFADGWQSNAGAPLLIAKRADGFVAFAGAVSGGPTADGSLILQLPASFRPRTTHRRQVFTGAGTMAVVEVRTNGGVAVMSGGAADMALNFEYLAA